MLLHQEFIRNAKRFASKPAIIDRFLDKTVSYEKALIASLILANKFRWCPLRPAACSRSWACSWPARCR